MLDFLHGLLAIVVSLDALIVVISIWYLQRRVAANKSTEDEREEAADIAAKELLFAHLNAEQRKSWLEDRAFSVIGGTTGTEYLLQPSIVANIKVTQMDRELYWQTAKLRTNMPYSENLETLELHDRLCLTTFDDIPLGDQLLAQKIMLECDELSALATANIFKMT